MRFLFLMLLCFGVSSMAYAYSPSCQTSGDGDFVLDESLDGVKIVIFDCLRACRSHPRSRDSEPDLVQFNVASGDKISFDVKYFASVEVDQYEKCLPVNIARLIRFIGERKGGVLTIYPTREHVENVTSFSFSSVKISLPSGIETSVIP